MPVLFFPWDHGVPQDLDRNGIMTRNETRFLFRLVNFSEVARAIFHGKSHGFMASNGPSSTPKSSDFIILPILGYIMICSDILPPLFRYCPGIFHLRTVPLCEHEEFPESLCRVCLKIGHL